MHYKTIPSKPRNARVDMYYTSTINLTSQRRKNRMTISTDDEYTGNKIQQQFLTFKLLTKQDLKEYIFQINQQQSQAKRQHHM